MTENLADMLQDYKKKKLEEPEIEEPKCDEQKSNLTIPNQTLVNMISFINWIDKNTLHVCAVAANGAMGCDIYKRI